MISTSDLAVDDALARAVVYRALALGFQTPTPERLQKMGANEGFATVRSALGHLAQSADRADFEEPARRLGAGPAPVLDEAISTFVRLFGHTARGLVCACETEYGADNMFHQPQQLADISGYYLAFGLQPIAAADVRVDHIACELEFIAFLNRKLAWLLTDADAAEVNDTLEATERAERSFLRDHLARFGRAFGVRVVAEAPSGYFGALGHALLALLAADCARLGVAAGPVDLVVRPEEADNTPTACGSTDELIQIRRKP